MFHVGQKVVCVDVGTTPFSLNGALSTDAVYIIREVGLTRLGSPGVKIENYEYSCHPWQHGTTTLQHFTDAMLASRRFRPVQEKKTDISIFTKMLTGTKAPEHV